MHIGNGLVLTCAHVVDRRDDDEEGRDDDELDAVAPSRLGRQKLVMFPHSGRTFISECCAVDETADGGRDVAVVVLGAEVAVATLPHTNAGAAEAAGKKSSAKRPGKKPAGQGGGGRGCGSPPTVLPPSAVVAAEPVELGMPLFCIGNPSTIDLESLKGSGSSTEFEPPTWHTSVGCCEGYVAPATQAARDAQSARGRPPTRGELKLVAEAAAVASDEGGYLQHSCWTYWGHSGAPLFDAAG